jgi:hypothetical protein
MIARGGVAMTHTPAPWRADGEDVWMPPQPDFGAPGLHVVSPNSEADARLIAAAPELYEALVALLQRFHDDNPMNSGAFISATVYREVVESARAAIRKATEEES